MTAANIKPISGSQLPLGWCYSRLQDVIMEAQPGFACGARSPSGVIQLRMNNVDTRGNFVWDEFIRVPIEVTDLDKYRLEPGDILFNNTNSTELVGKSALFQGHSEPVVYSNHFTRIRVNTECAFPVYIVAWLIWQHQLGTFGNLCNRWIGQSAVKNEILFSLEIPLPPTLVDQERIARILTEQMAAVEKARAAAAARLDAAKALPMAYLRQIFEIQEARNWQWVLLGDICDTGRGRVISQTYIKAHPGLYPVYSSQTKDDGIFGYIDSYDFEGDWITWTTDGANAGTVFLRQGRFNLYCFIKKLYHLK
jgi:restriction endonuclease S subunit